MQKQSGKEGKDTNRIVGRVLPRTVRLPSVLHRATLSAEEVVAGFEETVVLALVLPSITARGQRGSISMLTRRRVGVER